VKQCFFDPLALPKGTDLFGGIRCAIPPYDFLIPARARSRWGISSLALVVSLIAGLLADLCKQPAEFLVVGQFDVKYVWRNTRKSVEHK